MPFDGAPPPRDRGAVARHRPATAADRARRVAEHASTLAKVLERELTAEYRARLERQVDKAYAAIKPRTWPMRVVQLELVAAFDAAAKIARLRDEGAAIRHLMALISGALNDDYAPPELAGRTVEKARLVAAFRDWRRRPGQRRRDGAHREKYEALRDIFKALGIPSGGAPAIQKAVERAAAQRERTKST
jgi:hypothetical protein